MVELRKIAEAPFLIIIEGANEVGKTTLASKLAETFSDTPFPCEVVAFPGNNSGTLGNLIKRIHENPASFEVESIDPTSLQLLHIAAHVDAIEGRIRPLLEEGTSVILDRFWWSTLIYGRLTDVNERALDDMIRIEKRHWGDLIPDKVFLIDRDTPLESNLDLAHWKRIRYEYLDFARSAEHSYPVEIISNDSSVENALMQIRSSLQATLSANF